MPVLPVIDALVAHLQTDFPHFQVDYFPQKPAEFRLNHPTGALLVSYAGSRFDKPQALGAVIQTQTLSLCVTVVFRQLNGKQGALAVLDALRQTLGGLELPHCRRGLWLTRESFLGESQGLWQYALDMSTESLFIEDAPLPDGALLTHVNHEEIPS